MILITGATGFLGRNLLSGLAESRKDIVCLLRETNKNNIAALAGNAQFVCGDLRNKESLLAATKNAEAVINLAAATSGNKNTLYETNVAGTKNLVMACEKNKVKKLIHISSSAATKIRRDDYGESKRMSDEIIMDSRLNWVILRPGMVYGKGSRGLNGLVNYVKATPFVVPILGDGEYKSSPAFVDDVCSAIIKALGANISGKIYDICGPSKLTFNEIVDSLCEHLNVKKFKLHIPLAACLLAAKLLQNIPGFPVNENFISAISEDSSADIAPAVTDLDYAPLEFSEGLRLAL